MTRRSRQVVIDFALLAAAWLLWHLIRISPTGF